jgi:septation ring formation regulator EzrA
MDLERIAKLEAQVESIKEDVKEVRDDIKELHSRITTQTREIEDKMDDMQTRIEHKMNAQAEVSAAQHKSIQEEIRKDVEKIENRVTSLERWKWYIMGGAIAIGYIIGHIDFFANLLK